MGDMEDGSTARESESPQGDDQNPLNEASRHKRRKRPNLWKLIRALLLAGRIIWWMFED